VNRSYADGGGHLSIVNPNCAQTLFREVS
jgi:hypothetical protein